MDETDDETVCRILSVDPMSPAIVAAAADRQKFELEAEALYGEEEAVEEGEEESEDSDFEALGSDSSED